MIKQNMTSFIHTQKQKFLSMNLKLMIYLYQTTLQLYRTFLGKSSGWIIDSIIDHKINISKYNSWAGSSCTKLPNELEHPRKGLININNIDYKEWFKWNFVRYLYPSDHQPARITKDEKYFAGTLYFKGIKFLVKVKDIQKIPKNNFIGVNVFVYDNKE